MAEIIKFGKEEPLIWVCECGCSTFRMLSDDTAECAACDQLIDGMGGGWIDLDRKSDMDPEDVFADTQGNGSVEFARRRVAQMASDENAALLIVARHDGSLSTWSAAETPEQLQWAVDKCAQAADLMQKKDCG